MCGCGGWVGGGGESRSALPILSTANNEQTTAGTHRRAKLLQKTAKEKLFTVLNRDSYILMSLNVPDWIIIKKKCKFTQLTNFIATAEKTILA